MAGIELLGADAGLAAAVGPTELAFAQRSLIAVGVRAPAGRWRTARLAPDRETSLGLLITEGIALRTMTLDGRKTAQLFGPGDLVRPWNDGDIADPADLRMSWTAMTPVVAGLIDRRFLALAARWPAVLVELGQRLGRQVDRVALQVAIARIPRIDERLLLAFWRLGQRWGRVTPDGVLLPLNLTHDVVASLVGASRPPASAALAQLARDGLLRRTDRGWLIDLRVEARIAAPPADAVSVGA